MPKHVAYKNPRRGVGQRQHTEKIAPDLLSRLIPMAESEPTLFWSKRPWKSWIFLGEKHLLDIARHFEVGFELGVLDSRFFRGFPRCDVLYHPFVIEEFTRDFVMNRTRVLRNPNGTSVPPANLRFEVFNSSIPQH